MNILHVKSMTLTHILCVRCSFWRFLPFEACFTITVIPVIGFFSRRELGPPVLYHVFRLFQSLVFASCQIVTIDVSLISILLLENQIELTISH